MSLSHAILGLLQQEPMTGYDLKTQCFDESIAHFWPADQSQIYRTLDQMADEGWVEANVEIQTDRPNRKVYEITQAGRKELLRWLRTQPSAPAYREPLLVQIFFADLLSKEEVLSKLEAHLGQHRERQETFEQLPLPEIGTPGLSRRHSYERLTLELGLRIQQAYIDWLEFSIKTVEEMD